MLLCCSRGDGVARENKNVSITLQNDSQCTQAIAGEQSVAVDDVKKNGGEMEEAHREINFSLQFLFCCQRHRYRWCVQRENCWCGWNNGNVTGGNNFRVCSRFFTRFSLHFSVLSAATWKQTFLCASALKKWTEKAFQLSLLTAQLRYVLKVRFLTCCFVCCLFQRTSFVVKSVGRRNVERWNIFKVRAMFWWSRTFVAMTRGGRKFLVIDVEISN